MLLYFSMIIDLLMDAGLEKRDAIKLFMLAFEEMIEED